jgi:hypothetical protein
MALSTANVHRWQRNRLLHATSIHVGEAGYWGGTVVQYIQRRRAAMWRADGGCSTADDNKHWIPTPAVAKLTETAQQGVIIVDREAFSAQMADRRRRE